METKNDDTISIEKIFYVPTERLWRAWTEPSQIMQWFGSDPDGKVLKAEMKVVPGGSFEITFKDSNATEHTCYGIYREVDKNRKLSFTWIWKNEPGVQSLVTVVFTSENDFTLMQFEHAHVGYASAHNYLEGWNKTFIKLDQSLKG